MTRLENDLRQAIDNVRSILENGWARANPSVKEAIELCEQAIATVPTGPIAYPEYAPERAVLEDLTAARVRDNRREGVKLTAYDTGDVLEPKAWPGDTGRVDFEDPESNTILTVLAHPSPIAPEAHTLVIEQVSSLAGSLRVVVNGEIVWQGRVL